MNRDFLKNQGLTDEQANAIMAEYGKAVNPLTDQVAKLTSERDDLQGQINERDGQLKDLKATVNDNDELTAKIADLEKANKDAKTSYENKLKAQDKEFKITNALRDSGARNVKAVQSLLDLDKVSVDDNGTLIGLSDQLKAVKESDGYLFQETQNNDEGGEPKSKITITGGQPSNGNSNQPTMVDRIAARLAGKE